ncbi:MAG TPA: twin-arginine translocase TatA/TatE family subunit [Sphingobacteriaceae bacterium]|nr:twin-arginine translocase TatA/TatE family subunit [Sphingobacteriaceae bacterium]
MTNQLLIAGLGSSEIIIILVVILLMFGGKKIPELMRGLGRGVKEFKDAKDSPPSSAPENEDHKV